MLSNYFLYMLRFSEIAPRGIIGLLSCLQRQMVANFLAFFSHRTKTHNSLYYFISNVSLHIDSQDVVDTGFYMLL